MKRLFVAFALILAVSTFAAAEVYVKSNSHTDPISVAGQNQPAKDTVTEQWIGEGKMASVSSNNTVILDLNKKVMHIVNHKTKTYIETTLPLDLAKLMPSEMAGMLQNMKATVSVTPTGNKKDFGKRSCDEYNVTLNMSMMSLNIKVYASTDVPFDYQTYWKLQSNLLKSQMMGIDDASIQELGKIKGFWIAEEITMDMMGSKVRQTMEVIEIANKPAPAGIYSVPPGYTKQNALSLQDLQNQQ
jgi:hypothetical protein